MIGGKKMTKRRKSQENQFLRSLDGLAYGMFITIVIGAFLGVLSDILHWPILSQWGTLISQLAGPAIGIGVAYATGSSGIVLLSAALAGSICMSDHPAWPICAYLAVMAACYIGHFCQDKTPLDIFVAPLVTIIMAGITAYFVAPYIEWAIDWLIGQMAIALDFPLWLMAIFTAVLMGFCHVLPLFTLTLSYSLGLEGLNAGAAIAGACAVSMGFAMMSMDDNEIGDVLAIAVGTPLLQFKNVLKHPLILIPPLLTALVSGLVSVLVLQLSGTAYGAGVGNMAFAGVLSIVSTMGSSAWLVVILVDILLPIVLCYSMYRALKRIGWIHPGDLKINRL